MPSPFPGMDPFIEGQRWRDFRTRLVTVLSEMLTPEVRPRYVVEVDPRAVTMNSSITYVASIIAARRFALRNNR